MITITVFGIPKPKGSLRHVGNGRLVEQVKGSGTWRKAVAAAADAQYRGFMLTGPVEVWIAVTVPRPKTVKRDYPITRSSGDGDKHARNCLDALVDAEVLADDSQVVDHHVSKRYVGWAGALDEPGAVIRVRDMGELGEGAA